MEVVVMSSSALVQVKFDFASLKIVGAKKGISENSINLAIRFYKGYLRSDELEWFRNSLVIDEDKQLIAAPKVFWSIVKTLEPVIKEIEEEYIKIKGKSFWLIGSMKTLTLTKKMIPDDDTNPPESQENVNDLQESYF